MENVMSLKDKMRLNKIVNILIYFANNTEKFGLTKANKLLYYTDCLHLEKYLRPVIDDVYKKDDEGPVPQEVYARLKVLDPLCKEVDFNYEEYFGNFLEIVSEPIHVYTLHKIQAIKEFDSRWLSQSELEVIKELAEKYKYTTAKELSEKTHLESPWLEAKMYDDIDITLYVKDKIKAEHYAYIKHSEAMKKAVAHNYN